MRADNAQKPCYDLRVLSHNLDICTTLVKYMQEVGWDPYANDHEDANCQFEINWTYSDALTTADRHVFFRYMVKQLAEQHGPAGDLHAEAVPQPDRQRRPLPHEPVGRADGPEPLPGRVGPEGALARWPTTSSAASRRTPARWRR